MIRIRNTGPRKSITSLLFYPRIADDDLGDDLVELLLPAVDSHHHVQTGQLSTEHHTQSTCLKYIGLIFSFFSDFFSHYISSSLLYTTVCLRFV